MREILFRGKRINNSEWVEGSLLKANIGGKIAYLIFGNMFSLVGNEVKSLKHALVDPKTIGQYTGLTDKNGKRIFEGDVVAQSWYDFDEPADDCFGEVIFSMADCSFSILDLNKKEIMTMGQGRAYHWEAEVIGNIHDNPELLEAN